MGFQPLRSCSPSLAEDGWPTSRSFFARCGIPLLFPSDSRFIRPLLRPLPAKNLSSRPEQSWAFGPPKEMKIANHYRLCRSPVTAAEVSATLPFVIPSEAEGSAVQRTSRGNVFRPEHSKDLPRPLKAVADQTSENDASPAPSHSPDTCERRKANMDRSF
jgi:hypothetical protein